MSGRPCLPCCRRRCRTAGPLCSAGITPPPRSYGPVRHPLAVGRFPGCAGYTAYPAPPISRRDEEGFSSCLTCPGHRADAHTPPEGTCRASQTATVPAAFARKAHARPPGQALSGLPLRSLTLRPGHSLAILADGVVDGLQSVGSPPPCHPSYGVSGSYPGGTTPHWTRLPFWTRTSRCKNDRAGVDHGRRADPASVWFVRFLVLYPRVASNHLPVFVTRSEGPLGRARAGHWRSRRAPPSAPSPRGLDIGSVEGHDGASGR